MTRRRPNWTSSAEYTIAGESHTKAEVPVLERKVFSLNHQTEITPPAGGEAETGSGLNELIGFQAGTWMSSNY
jgi:hypothetical protein